MKAIDWDSVQSFAPIPRLMPAREATNAVDAGFAQEWFEHSIGGWQAESVTYRGKFVNIPIEPLALQIMSQSKSLDDEWATGVESELRSIIEVKEPGGCAADIPPVLQY